MAASLQHQERMLAHLDATADIVVKRAKELWAPSIKLQLGEVYHLVRGGKVANCNPRIRIDASQQQQGRPLINYCCASCRRHSDRGRL